jgi:hypothetical protein
MPRKPPRDPSCSGAGRSGGDRRRLAGAYRARNKPLVVGGKTGSGDNALIRSDAEGK